MELLGIGNTKTLKGQKNGYLTGILHLAPHTISGYNVCPMASKGCSAACLYTAGRGRFTKTQISRIRKTREFFESRHAFMVKLIKDIRAIERKANRMGLLPAIRLNGTSDIRWETVPVHTSITSRGVTTIYHANNIMEAFPHIQFYDYTKIPNRRHIPANYHLTFSLSEDNDTYAKKAIDNGMNVAAVFKNLPITFFNLPVINGDDTDLRFTDPKGCVVGLSAKGDAKKDTSGFVR